MQTIDVNGAAWTIQRLLGHGKGGYSYLAQRGDATAVLKQYIPGDTICELLKRDADLTPYLIQVRQMAAQATAAGLNIDYFPTNFVVCQDTLYYIDYECNPYTDEWNFENWGVKYWSRTPEFESYLASQEKS